ncbi:T-cell surface glycoprotein CD8 alpha chain isoform 2-T2 [Odontesthes bonariensis]|uniref:T-cell surface glycoprotein CD8 alpha chain isoform X2 n=1 Tax=Odontesthes bonariensis TaxID=219752 RepID=UPI003F58FA5E
MDRKWIQILVILVFFQQITSGAVQEKTVMEGQEVDVTCQPSEEGGTMVIWFRVLDVSGMEFIASFSPSGTKKASGPNYDSIFQHRNTKLNEYVLKLKSFKNSDRGIYSCASLIRGTKLSFGEVTRLVGEPTRESPPLTTKRTPSTTTTSCACKEWSKPAPVGHSLFCAPIILAPLVGGCGFLLLLLIIISSYCNYVRTRRCPHHHKRMPRMKATDKLPMTNRHS